jgi:hypothetical protein
MLTHRLPPLALAALLAAGPALAQDQGFAIEITPPADEWTGFRIGVAVFGETVEPAAGYVRGCPGHVTAEAAGVLLQVAEGVQTLTLTLADDAIQGLVMATPDGLFRCVRRGADGLVAARLDRPEAGLYRVWPAGPEASRIATRMLVADRPISAIELRGLDVAALGAPRAGSHAFTGESPRQTLARGATLFAQDAMDPLNPAGYCAGFGRFDAPDAVLTLAEGQRNLAVYARSEVDLTLAVRTPDGQWLCNDDSFGLDPAVIVDTAPAGDYIVFVGAFGQGREGRFDLFANTGAPSWDGTVFQAGQPRQGRVMFDRDQAGRGAQVLAQGNVVADQPLSMLPIPNACAGHVGIDAPDAIVTLGQREEMISLFATSQTDLVMAVRTPEGQWYCNDDSFGLNPAVQVYGASAGDYLVYVGAYSQGAAGRYVLMAAMGEPNWEGLPDAGQPGRPNPLAEPSVGRVGFGPATAIDPRVIFDIAPSQTEARGLGEGCVGFITPAQPDLVVSAEPRLPQLMVYMVAENDGVLLVVGPDGTIHCNDDFDGLNPGVMIPNPMAGDYAVFAGTYGGQGGIATLGVTIANPIWAMDREH